MGMMHAPPMFWYRNAKTAVLYIISIQGFSSEGVKAGILFQPAAPISFNLQRALAKVYAYIKDDVRF
jgi:hypothetical protein